MISWIEGQRIWNKLTQISLRNIRSIDVVVCRLLRNNRLGFKSTECCWLYAANPFLNVRYEGPDKVSERPCWKPGQYLIIKLKRDNDILQRAWHWFNTQVDMKYLRPALVVNVDCDWMESSIKIMSPLLERVDNG